MARGEQYLYAQKGFPTFFSLLKKERVCVDFKFWWEVLYILIMFSRGASWKHFFSSRRKFSAQRIWCICALNEKTSCESFMKKSVGSNIFFGKEISDKKICNILSVFSLKKQACWIWHWIFLILKNAIIYSEILVVSKMVALRPTSIGEIKSWFAE